MLVERSSSVARVRYSLYPLEPPYSCAVHLIADDSTGYFVQPTVILTKDPKSVTMQEEIFGPVLTVSFRLLNRYLPMSCH